MNRTNDQQKNKLWKAYFLLLILAWVGHFILSIPIFTSNETDAGLVAAPKCIQLFIAAIFIAGSYVIYRKLRNNQRARKTYGRVIAIGWIIIIVSAVALMVWSGYMQSNYEEHYRPFTEQEVVSLIKDCQITEVTSDNESWRRVHLKSGEDRAVADIDLQSAEEEMGHIFCSKGVNTN